MRVTALSDTHSQHDGFMIPAGDVLVHAGDVTREGRLEELKHFNEWLETLPFKHTLVVPGNHDFCFEDPDRRDRAEAILTEGELLIDEARTIGDVKFWGSPWQPRFFDWAFNRERGRPLREKWALIPEDADVLITHGPPKAIGDRVAQGDRVGCEELRKRVLEVEPSYHVFGHIHEGYGRYREAGVEFLNVSVCDFHRRPRNAPIVFTV